MSRRRDPPLKNLKPLPPLERLHELFHYDRETGLLRWRIPRGRAGRGAIAGAMRADGHRVIKLDGESFLASRIAWKMVRGQDPRAVIDHRDRNPGNNQFRNLRDVTQQRNATNQSIRSDNTSGYKGVFYSKREKKWRARITVEGKTKYLGYFKTSEDASYDYLIASLIFHPYSLPLWS